MGEFSFAEGKRTPLPTGCVVLSVVGPFNGVFSNLTLGSGITEMQLMWILMGIMAIHHTWMWWKMRSKKCNCKK